MRAEWKDWLALLVWVAICFVAAGFGSAFTASAVRAWYPAIAKPAWTPPNWVFGPVWTVLYVMMGIAAWLVWRKTGLFGGQLPLALFVIQLLLNVAWPLIFFGLTAIGPAFFEIVVLWCAVAATIAAFLRISRLAGWLLVPYLVWVTFAAMLNFAIWQLNP